jgi:hypothetical protein
MEQRGDRRPVRSPEAAMMQRGCCALSLLKGGNQQASEWLPDQ